VAGRASLLKAEGSARIHREGRAISAHADTIGKTAGLITALAALIAAIVGFLQLPPATLLIIVKVSVYVIIMFMLTCIAFLSDADPFAMPDDVLGALGYLALLALIVMGGYAAWVTFRFVFDLPPNWYSAGVGRTAGIVLLGIVAVAVQPTWAKVLMWTIFVLAAVVSILLSFSPSLLDFLVGY
jgi:hypothetical protein